MQTLFEKTEAIHTDRCLTKKETIISGKKLQ